MRRAPLFAATLVCLAGCRGILGIESTELVEDGGVDGGMPAEGGLGDTKLDVDAGMDAAIDTKPDVPEMGDSATLDRQAQDSGVPDSADEERGLDSGHDAADAREDVTDSTVTDTVVMDSSAIDSSVDSSTIDKDSGTDSTVPVDSAVDSGQPDTASSPYDGACGPMMSQCASCCMETFGPAFMTAMDSFSSCCSTSCTACSTTSCSQPGPMHGGGACQQCLTNSCEGPTAEQVACHGSVACEGAFLCLDSCINPPGPPPDN